MIDLKSKQNLKERKASIYDMILTKAERDAAKKARKLARRKARAAAAAKGLPPPVFFTPSNISSPSTSTTTTTIATNITTTTSTPRHTFHSKFNDHFETPFNAYADLEPILDHIKNKQQVIYDPFYCQGSMVSHLRRLGFNNVINRNEDFWQVLKEKTVPEFDVCVTNPPYSDQDKERCVQFMVNSKRPGFVLLPSYCANKTWMKRALSGQECFVIRPKEDYQFAHIQNKGHKKSPFHSSWFCLNLKYDEMKGVSPLVQKLESLGSVGVSFKKRPSSKRRKKLKRKSSLVNDLF
jgi:hypothetical protein